MRTNHGRDVYGRHGLNRNSHSPEYYIQQTSNDVSLHSTITETIMDSRRTRTPLVSNLPPIRPVHVGVQQIQQIINPYLATSQKRKGVYRRFF